MRMDLRYWGKSGVREVGGAQAMTFEPNLSRARVFFDGELIDPVRFREAISALHEVVVGDLKFHKRDKAVYKAYLRAREKEETELREATFDKVKVAEAKRLAKSPMSPTLSADFVKMHRLYWGQRVRWAQELMSNDPALFRALVPCDPVVTVAPDVVMFECFAKDEASYGCLSVDREAFRGADAAALGTTNVDYSLALYDHFQTLRTYRPTRLLVDPAGFEVIAGGGDDAVLREEKIDLPASWLRGFGQLQAAMALPARRLELSVDVVYSLLAYMKRHREKTGPRSLRFELQPGKPPRIVIEPWGVTLVSRGKPYDGPTAETIKVWGRRRLMAFARTLPLAEKFDVQLLGTGMPSVWVARMGELRMTIALSGWTANDWSGGSALDQYFGGFEAWPATIDRLARHLETVRSATLPQLVAIANEDEKIVLGSLHALAKRGQLAYDFASGVYRWRPIMDAALSESMLGPEPEEVVEGRRLQSDVKVERNEEVGAKRLVVAKVKGTSCEALFDLDGVISRAKCTCSFFHRMRLRAGPCRHLLALRLHVLAQNRPAPLPTARVLSPSFRN
ncbi:MAG: SWIM zinc finger domain-containing protein [Myxococcota bacterium]|nr:SWIM zinc finger domain-containing protein [Myxococcota bacterium]